MGGGGKTVQDGVGGGGGGRTVEEGVGGGGDVYERADVLV